MAQEFLYVLFDTQTAVRPKDAFGFDGMRRQGLALAPPPPFTLESDTISVSVSNSGECDARRMTRTDGGIGLANVRRRLALCYGEGARLEVNVADDITCIGFVLPLKHSREVSTLV